MSDRPLRVMWLLNHTTLRRFETAQLRKMGVREIFTPKSFPYDEGNASASLDRELDKDLTLPPEDLALLNRQDWYGSPSPEAWEAANRHFDIAFIGFFPDQVSSCVRHFKGSVVLRVFGLAEGETYTRVLQESLPPSFQPKLRELGDRFWFGAGYDHLREREGEFFRSRHCFLPLGLVSELRTDSWRGTDERVFFVCPRIGSSPHYRGVYRAFRRDFEGFPYAIGGIQPIRVDDPHVLGFVPPPDHEDNMRRFRVMYYHNTAPSHVHYHPFEAMRVGMPVVFMAGGMLDRFGGTGQPGRCRTVAEARRKISRILKNDRLLIQKIRGRQVEMLEPMKPENWGETWKEGFRRILQGVERSKSRPLAPPARPPRIAVIVPVVYRGGVLRAALLTAKAIELGSRQAGERAEVVLAHPNDPSFYSDGDFADLPPSIQRRPFQWKILDRGEAQRALVYAGITRHLDSEKYQVPDDGIAEFMDCDLWITGDRLERPLLPVKPYAVTAFDYLQRYENIMSPEQERLVLQANHAADKVFVTTEFTRRDALQYAGLPESKVVLLPMLAPKLAPYPRRGPVDPGNPYFLWTSNLAPHKNHRNALAALALYYEKWGGRLECRVTGADTERLLDSGKEHLAGAAEMVRRHPLLERNLKPMGDLPDALYREQLASARFLWHAGRVDNGAFSVVEAAHLGVPSLSSDYPAMREMDRMFGLNLSWASPHDPEDMAEKMKMMEEQAGPLREKLPSADRLGAQSLETSALAYWKAVKDCL